MEGYGLFSERRVLTKLQGGSTAQRKIRDKSHA